MLREQPRKAGLIFRALMFPKMKKRPIRFAMWILLCPYSKVIQELNETNEKLKKQNESLQKQINELKAKVAPSENKK